MPASHCDVMATGGAEELRALGGAGTASVPQCIATLVVDHVDVGRGLADNRTNVG